MAAPLQFADLQKGALVWVEEDGYPTPAVVENPVFGGKGVSVRALHDHHNDNKVIQDPRRIRMRIANPETHEDLMKLDEISDAAILWNIHNRFGDEKFTTYLGDVIVAVNSFKTVEIDDAMIKIYKNSCLGSRPAHLYAIGESAYSNMVDSRQNQIIIPSGESGSGKSEACKTILNYLTQSVANKIRSSKDANLTRELIVDTLPLLEAVGNAKTLLNDNATRQARYTEIQFKQGRIYGAKTETFAIEQSRIVGQAKGERNYHIFYQMLQGLSPELKTKFGLTEPHKYFYINQGKCSEINSIDDGEEFKKVMKGLDLIGMSADQVHSLFRILAAILHLGNVYFEANGDGVTIGNKAEVQWVAYLLQMDIDQLTNILTVKRTQVNGEKVKKPLQIGTALDMRDAMSKLIYSKLVSWLVGRMNRVTESVISDNNIALVDMFGFQRQSLNSLDELCMNFANERMQQFFTRHVFKLEQQEYNLEKLDWDENIGADLDNTRIIDLIVKRPHGIFHLLDDESSFPKASDSSFLRKCHYNHVDKSYYSKPQANDIQFCVKHYNGWQWYQAEGFLEKNRVAPENPLTSLLADSQNATLKQMMQDPVSKQHPTAVSHFTNEIEVLCKRFTHAKPHFIRCIKANNDRRVNDFDDKVVFAQIKHLGLTDTLRVRKLGFPYTYTFRKFVLKFGNLLPRSAQEDRLDKEIVYSVMSSQGLMYSEQYQIGSNKVFIQQPLHEQLESQREKIIYRSAVTIQKNVRTHVAKAKYNRKKKAALKIQSAERGRQARKKYSSMRKELYHDVAQQARKSKRLQVYEQLQQKRQDPLNQEQQETMKSRVVASVESMEAPKDLAPSMVNVSGEVSDYMEKCVSRVSKPTALFAVQHMIPKDLNEFPWSEYVKNNMRGHSLGMRREPITVPFLAHDEDREFQQALAIFKLILRYMNASSMPYAQEVLLADYIVQQGIEHELMRDEIYAQIVNQTISNPNVANRVRGWGLLVLAASSFLPSKQMVKHLLNYVHNCEDSEGYGSLVCAKLLQGVHQCSKKERNRVHPPCLLEHAAVREKGRMVIHAMLPDHSPVTCPVESWCSAADLAQRSLRERGISRSFGWTVGIDCNNLDELYISGDEYFLDVVSHIELPQKFPTSKPDVIANFRPQQSRGLLFKTALSRRKPIQQTNNEEMIPNEPRPSGNYRTQPRQVNAPAPAPPIPEVLNNAHKIPEKLFGVEDPEPCYDTVPSPPRHSANPPQQQFYARPHEIMHPHSAHEYGSSNYGRFMPGRTVLSTIPSMTETQSQYHDRQGSSIRDDTIGGSFLGDYHSASIIHGRTDSPDAIYGRSGQPISQISMDDGTMRGDRSTLGNQEWQRLPSEYSVRSIASHVRRVPLPCKNSEVDKFLDDLFDPVLKESVGEDIYDCGSIVASIKGGGEEQGGYPPQPAPYSPQINQPMLMMMPMDPRMFAMNSPAMQMQAQPMMQGIQTQPMMQGIQTQPMMQGMQAQPMMQGIQAQQMMQQGMQPQQIMQGMQGVAGNQMQFMPMFMPMPWGGGMMSPGVRPAEQGEQAFMVENGASPEQIPSPPTLPPEPSYPPPPPPHLPRTAVNNNVQYEQPGQALHSANNNNTMVPVNVNSQINYNDERGPGGKSLIMSAMRPSNDNARMVIESNQQGRPISHNIRDIMSGGVEEHREELQPSVVYSQIERPPTIPGPNDLERMRQQEALRMMRENSKGLPPPIEQFNLLRGPPMPIETGRRVQQIPHTPRSTREQYTPALPEHQPMPSVPHTPRPQDHLPPPLPEHERELPAVPPMPPPGDWVNEEEVSREAPYTRQRHQPVEYPTERLSDNMDDEIELGVVSESRERQKKMPVMGYNDVPYECTVRKELFFPNEQLNEAGELDLVFSQVLGDCLKSGHLRIRSYEKQQLLAMLHSYGVRTDSVKAEHVPAMLKRSVVEIARQWPLYFCRLYPVVEDRSNEYVAQFLAVSETGVRLVIRNFDAPKDPLKILDHFNFDDLDRVECDSEQLCLVTRRGLQVRVFTHKAPQIKQLIEDYLYGPNQDKQFVRAISDYVTKEPNLLSFREGDIIELVSNDATQEAPRVDDLQSRPRWMYGKLNGRFGNFPSGYVQALDPETLSPRPLDSQDMLNKTHATNYSFDETHSTVMTEDPWLESSSSGHPTRGTSGRSGQEKLTMMEFAMMFFRHGPGKHMIVKGEDGNARGTLKPNDKKLKKEKEWTWKELADQVKFARVPTNSSLLRLESNDYNKKAVDCFNAIMRYMGDQPLRKGQTLADCVYEMLMNCHQNPPLRDEVYCQMMKQTTNNKSANQDSPIRGWRLFTLLTSYFNCSDVLKPYLFKYLSDAAGDTRRAYHGTAQVCLQNLKKTFKFGGRKYLIGGKEIEAVTMGKNLKRQIYQLPGGHQKVVNTKSVTVVEEIIQELCQQLNIRSPLEQQEFCLCYILENDNVMKLLSNDEYILDVTTELEHKDKQFFLLLKRTVWIQPLRLDNECYIDVMFFQLVPDYLEGLLVTMKSPESISAAVMDDIARLAALLHRADQEANNLPINPGSVQQLLPRIVQNVRHVTPEQWADRVKAKIDRLPSNLSHSQARARFLDLLQSWQLFGSTFFYITNLDDQRVQGECLLAINKQGIQFLHIVTHEVLADFRLSEVLSTHKVTTAPPLGGPPQHFLDVKVGNLIQQRVLTLETDQGTEISRLLGQYIFVDSQNRGFINNEPANNS